MIPAEQRTERDHRIRLRIAQDVIAAGSATYWGRRADTFDWARPRPGDYTGQATAASLRARDERCAAAAEACRAHARVIEGPALGAVA